MKVVKQRDLKDCGVCSLQSIILHYKGYVPLEKIRLDTYTTKNGTNALHLVNAAKKYGFDSYGTKLLAKDLFGKFIETKTEKLMSELDNQLMEKTITTEEYLEEYQILLYDYHNPQQTLFTKAELKKIVEIITENIREKFPGYPTPLELSKESQKREAVLAQRLPKGKKWIFFSSSVFGHIIDKENKGDKAKYNYHLDTLIEFLVIMNVDEIVEFMIVYNNYYVERTFSVLKKRALELGHTELAKKIKQSLDEFTSRFKKTIEFYMNIYRRGELEKFAMTLAIEDKHNLIDFFKLYNLKNPKHSLFTPEELTNFIKIIESSSHEQSLANELPSETQQLTPTDKSVIKLKNLLGIYNRKMIKQILSNPSGIFSSDNEKDIILDFLKL